MIKTLPIIILPLILSLCGIAMLFGKELYDDFAEGVKEGIQTALSLLPSLIGLMTAVGIFNASGAAEALAKLCTPLLESVGIPGELAPMLMVRPVSGSAANALFDGILTKYGPDSFTGRCASVISGASDTGVYIITLYFGSVGTKKTGASVPCALMTMIFTVVLSCLTVRLIFG